MLTAADTISTVTLVDGASNSISLYIDIGLGLCKLRSTVGGASAFCSTSGSKVLGRPRLLISIPCVVLVADDDNDGRDDVTVTSRPVCVVIPGFGDVVSSVVPLSARGSCFFSADA